MVREIVKDTDTLRSVSAKVNPTSADTKRVIKDLLDTAIAHKDKCVGMAAIQIGEPVRVIVVFDGVNFIPYINPVITKYHGAKYTAQEGCVSLDGIREVERYEAVEVMHQTAKGFVKFKCAGIVAEIMQHEVDHLNGKLI